jgi:type II secretory pathway component GspD/PulD (secretin)
MNYNVSSNPSAQNGGGAGGVPYPGGGASGTASTGSAAAGATPSGAAGANNTNMRVAGGAGSVFASFERALRQLAGENASISIIPETGFLSVRADGTALRRVSTFLESFTRDAGRQVQLKAALIEITLGNETAYGIDWNRVLHRSNSTANIGFATTGVVPGNAVVNATITTSSITSVIKALESEQAVRVVAEPELWMLNHQPGIVYAATQRPYLGQVTTTVSGNANITSTSGSLSYVQDGVSLAFQPNILDNARAELTVIPVLSTAVNPQIFKPGNGLELTGFDLPTSSTHMKLLLDAGKTYIVGGNRFTTDNFNQAGIPGVRQTPILGQLLSGTDDLKRTKELVLMLRTTIVPAPDLNIVVGEAL